MLFGVAAAAGAAPIFTPAGAETADQNIDNCWPLGCTSGPVSYQQIYSSSFFGVDEVLISSMAFRVDGAAAATSFTATFPFVQIMLGTTLTEPDTSGGLIAGDGMQTVLAGPLLLSHNGATPTAFDVVVTFSSPYLYDPTAGNLLFQFNRTGNQIVTTATGNFFVDAAIAADDGISRRWSSTSGDTLGIVTQFNVEPVVTPVPEPTSLLLFGSGAAAVAAAKARRRKKQESR